MRITHHMALMGILETKLNSKTKSYNLTYSQTENDDAERTTNPIQHLAPIHQRRSDRLKLTNIKKRKSRIVICSSRGGGGGTLFISAICRKRISSPYVHSTKNTAKTTTAADPRNKKINVKWRWEPTSG